MSSYAVDLDDADEVVALIKSAGIRSVSTEAAELNMPAVWVQIVGFTFDRLAGYTLNTRIVLVVGDRKPARARRELAELLNKVLTKVNPGGPVVARTYQLPENPTPFPGLSFPLNVRCTAPEETTP